MKQIPGDLTAVDDVPANANVTKTVAYNAGGPMQRVVVLLEKIKEDSLTALEENGKEWNSYACFVKEETAARGDAIETAKDSLTKLSQDMGSELSTIKDAEMEIKKATAAKTKAEGEIKDLLRRNQDDTDAFAKSKNEYIETINVLGKALEAMGAALIQQDSRTSFLQAESQQLKKTLALVQQMTGKSVGEGNMGQASGFLSQLKEETAMNLQSATKAYLDGKAAFQQGMMAQQQIVAVQTAVIAAYEKAKADAIKAKGEMMKEYIATKEKMDGDVKFFEALQKEAAEKHTKFSTLTADTEAQVSACTEAITVLKDHLKSGFFFTQLHSSQTRFSDSVNGLSSVLAKISKAPRAAVLTAFLGVKTATGSGAADKIKSLCDGLITQLQDEIKKVQEAKLDCANKEAVLKSEITEAQRNIDEQANIAAAKKKAKENMENQQEETGKAIKALAVTLRNLNQQCSYEQTQLDADIATNKKDGEVLDLAMSKLEAVFGESAAKVKDEVKDVKDAANSNDFDEYEAGGSRDARELKVKGASGRQTGGAMVMKLLQQIKDSTEKTLGEMKADLAESKLFCAEENARIGTTTDTVGASTEFGGLFAKYTDEGATIASLADDMQTALDNKLAFEGDKDAKIKELNAHGIGTPPDCTPSKFDSIVEAKRADIDGLQTVIRYMNSIGGSSALSIQ